MAPVQVIDLLSSDDNDSSTAIHQRPLERTSRIQASAAVVQPHKDPFDILDDLDLPLPSPKRQKRDSFLYLSDSGSAESLKHPALIRKNGLQPRSETAGPALTTAASDTAPPGPGPADPAELSLSSDPAGSDCSGASSPREAAAPKWSLATASLLAEISRNLQTRPRKTGTGKSSRSNARGVENAGVRTSRAGKDESFAADGPVDTKEERARKKEAERERIRVERELGKQEHKAEREKQKIQEKIKRRIEKERKEAEKQEAAGLAAANKARWDTKVSAREMIVDLPSLIEGKQLEYELREVLKPLDIEATFYTSILPNIIRFRRKVTTAYNEELGYREPVPQSIKEEKQILCLISGQHFLSMVTAPDTQREGVDAYVEMVRLKYPDYRITCLIDALEAAIKHEAKATRKTYNAAVRGDGQRTESINARQDNEAGMSLEDKIEKVLVALQVDYGCLVHHTESAKQTAEFIGCFTQQMSTIPYK